MTRLPSSSSSSSSSLHLYITPPAAHPRPRGPGGGSSLGWCSWRRSPLWRWRCRWWWSWTGCRCRRSHGPGTSGHSSGQCGVPLEGRKRRRRRRGFKREEMREDKRKHKGVAEGQRERGMGRKKRRENVRFIARQLRSAFIIHSVLFCPRCPGKCGEKHTSSRLSEIFCLNSSRKSVWFWFKTKFAPAPALISHLSRATWHLWDRNKGEMTETLVTLTLIIRYIQEPRCIVGDRYVFVILWPRVHSSDPPSRWHHHYITTLYYQIFEKKWEDCFWDNRSGGARTRREGTHFHASQRSFYWQEIRLFRCVWSNERRWLLILSSARLRERRGARRADLQTLSRIIITFRPQSWERDESQRQALEKR